MVLDVYYVGNHRYDSVRDQPLGERVRFGTLPAVAPDQRLLNASNLTNHGISNYNGITASSSQHVKWDLPFRFNYTYSHTSDDGSNGGVLPYSVQIS